MTTGEEILSVVLLALIGALTGLAIHGGWFDYNAAIGASIGAAIGLLIIRFSRDPDAPIARGGDRQPPRPERQPERRDPAHAPGHRHVPPPPAAPTPRRPATKPHRHEPWVPKSGFVRRQRQPARH